jgi:hypothetical protein
MKYVRIRLLYPHSIKPEEVGAAIRGMERFRAYGVLHDSTDVAGGRAALKNVRNAKAIKWLITAEEPAITRADFHGSMIELFTGSDIIPVGLTPYRMSEMVGDEYSMRREMRLGLSLENEGAVVSLFKAREMAGAADAGTAPPYRTGDCSELALKSIEAAVVHELGHVFGRKEHCPKDGCIMQANRNFADFIDRFVVQGADFCTDCAATVRLTVCKMISGF